jgi:type I restriction enzyme S subunit
MQMNFTPAEAATYALRYGDILLNEGQSIELVGRPAMYRDELPGVCFTNSLVRFRPSPHLEPRFALRQFQFFLHSGAFQKIANKTTSIAHLGADRFANMSFALAPLAEQRRIADILDEADALRKKRREALALTDELLRATFLEMFGDPVANPKGWSTASLDQIADVASGLQVTPARTLHSDSVPYLRVANVYRNRLDLTEVKTLGVTPAERERTKLRIGDLLLVEGHGNEDEVGRCALWSGEVPDCVHQNHLIRVRLHPRLLPQFAVFVLNSSLGRRQIRQLAKTTSGLHTISTNNVRSLTLISPPLDAQHRFVAACIDAQRVASSGLASSSHLDALFASLQHRAFRGEL